MSRSYKKAIIKDRSFGSKLYRKIVRNSQKNYMRSHLGKIISGDDYSIPDGKNIIDDYTYSDYKFSYEYPYQERKFFTDDEIKENKEKYKRK